MFARSAQRRQSKAARQKKGFDFRPVTPVKLPELPENVTLLHVEYDYGSTGRFDMHGGGNWEITSLYTSMYKKFGKHIQLCTNNQKFVKSSSPTFNVRPGAFEVTDMNTKEILYSKIRTGVPLIYDNGGQKPELERFFKKLEATYPYLALHPR